MLWETVDRPGYFGSRRNAMHMIYDDMYGTAGWRLRWQIGERIGELREAAIVYEDAYYLYLRAHSELVARLVCEASDVYDDSESNVNSALDYMTQETDRTHLQDIAIRRCLVRLGLVMSGTQLIQIRDSVGASRNTLSLALSPGRIPFHRPDWVIKPELSGWWQAGTIESWYQSNKLLQVRAGGSRKVDRE